MISKLATIPYAKPTALRLRALSLTRKMMSSSQLKRNASSMSISSSPSSANPEDGIANVHSSLRSIVMSRASFTLFRGFNPSSTGSSTAAGHLEIAGLTGPLYPDFINDTSTDHSSLLKNCVDGTDGADADAHAQRETIITSLLAMKLDGIGNKGERFTAKTEETLSNEERKGKINLIFSKKMESKTDPNATNKVPLGLVEVGLLRQGEADVRKLEHTFWQKAGQAMEYLRLLQGDNNWKWEEALLLGVLVATRDCNKGRLAVFVCEPKGNYGWRMALLWRAQLESLDKLSAAFGYYVNGLVYLSKEGANLTRNGEIIWEYLGPHCTKVEAKDTKEHFVLRSYDNRVRQTSRTPYVYKSWNKFKETMKHVLLVQDNDSDGDTLNFAVDEPKVNDKSMLFSKWNRGDKKGGKVEVIAVPFVAGDHRCKNSIQARSLVTYMKELHEDGFVHGDIRGLNMVFKTESDEAVLIDFDFGGKVGKGKPKYPPGYQKKLDDGYRIGKAGNIITKEIDAADLAYVLAILHNEPVDASSQIRLLFRQLQMEKNVDKMAMILEKMEVMGTVFFSPIDLYKQYLHELNDGTMTETEKHGNKATPDRKVEAAG